jgi:hypothetical protein
MAIYRLLQGAVFEPEAIAVMTSAYEGLLVDLQLVDRSDAFTERVAKEVIEVARLGVRDAGEIRRRVLNVLGKGNGRSISESIVSADARSSNN